MRLTSIELENFKGISQRPVIPIAPITLLFGANSAGKSTVLHALEYARQLLTYSTGSSTISTEMPLDSASLELGRFASLVHRNDVSKRIRLRFTMAVSSVDHKHFPMHHHASQALVHAWKTDPTKNNNFYLPYLIGNWTPSFLETIGCRPWKQT